MTKAGDETVISTVSRQMEREHCGAATERELRRGAAYAALKKALIGLAKAKRARHAGRSPARADQSI